MSHKVKRFFCWGSSPRLEKWPGAEVQDVCTRSERQRGRKLAHDGRVVQAPGKAQLQAVIGEIIDFFHSDLGPPRDDEELGRGRLFRAGHDGLDRLVHGPGECGA